MISQKPRFRFGGRTTEHLKKSRLDSKPCIFLFK